MTDNHFVRFVARPEGVPTPEVFALDQESLRDLAPGEFLVRHCYVSLDPALVGRMRSESNYADCAEPGEVMQAYGIGQVVASRNGKVKIGEVYLGMFGMQQYAICDDPAAYTAINTGLAEPTWYLSAVGITGATAYFGLHDLLQPKAGETLVISAGASSVGAIAAQLARKAGCRTVGIVSTDAKAARLAEKPYFDACVSYRGKDAEQLQADLRAVCPDGIDLYFDNTSGDISEALLDLYNDHARIAVIGRIALSGLDDTRNDIGRRDNSAILAHRIRKQGMVLFDYKPRMMEAVLCLSRMARNGELEIREEVLHGIDQLPVAFFRMLDGKADGKLIVKLADIEAGGPKTRQRVGKLLGAGLFPTETLVRLMRKRAQRRA